MVPWGCIYLHTLKTAAFKVWLPVSLTLGAECDLPLWDTARCQFTVSYWKPLKRK